MQPIINRNSFIFKSARVILNDKLCFDSIKDPRFLYVSCISHNKLEVSKNISTKEKKTIKINLENKNIDEVFAKFNDTSRNEIRKTFKSKEFSFSKNKNNFKEIYLLYKEFRKDKDLPLRKPNFFKSSKIFSAYYRGELVSVVTFYDVYPNLRIQNIFSKKVEDKNLRNHIGYATRRLIYEICRFGCEKNYRSLDLASINLKDPEKKGITSFKSSFGGEIINEYTYTYKNLILKFLGK